uniref:Uncharacterized protein n=1 Tax=Anguilla anguilla TaxID=7936 RepID=A0A0E9VEX3_ANGAN
MCATRERLLRICRLSYYVLTSMWHFCILLSHYKPASLIAHDKLWHVNARLI